MLKLLDTPEKKKKSNRGRRKIEDETLRRSRSIAVSLTPIEYDDVMQRAQFCGLKCSAYFRLCATQVAEHGFVEDVQKSGSACD